MEQFANEIISKINAEIEISCIDNTWSSDKALHIINFIRPLFKELREYIHEYNTQDSEEEICFFKNIKPLILSKLIYYNDIYTLELRKPNANKEVLKEYYKKKQTAIIDFRNNNLNFYQYYRSKATHLDKYYFLRGHENYKLCHNCGLLDKDPFFSSCCDHRVAKMLAYDILQQRLQDVERTEVIETSRAFLPDNPFRWTGTKVAAIELGYAISAAGVLNNGNAGIKEIMTYIEASLKIDLGDYYRTYLTIRKRKRDRTAFLNNLIEKLLRKMDENEQIPYLFQSFRSKLLVVNGSNLFHRQVIPVCLLKFHLIISKWVGSHQACILGKVYNGSKALNELHSRIVRTSIVVFDVQQKVIL